jgi:carboxymethylenebutenolidase
MSPFHRYLAEEVALDHVDGIIARREALRRLGLLGLTTGAAATLIAACGADEGGGRATPTPQESAPPESAPPVSPSPLATEAVTFPGPAGRSLQAAWVAAAEPRGAVLVIHENKGLNDHIRSVAGRFAAAGYSALAIDLLSAEGGSASFRDPGELTAALGRIPAERFVADLRAGVGELSRRAPGRKLAAVGFCFGGGMVWSLLGSGENRLSAAVPFYGPLPDGADFTGAGAAVLGVYAARDARVNASRDAATAALERAGLTHEVVTFPGADHAFFNDTGPRYNATAAADAWRRVMAWFDRHLAA